MNPGHRYRLWAIAAAIATLWLVSPGVIGLLAAQDAGTVEGTVVDAQTNRPVQGAQVTIVGTTRGVLTGSEGTFRIGNVPAGAREVRVQRIGYRTATQQVDVVTGQVARAEFTLQEGAVVVDEVIVTATGERQRRRELGNTVSTVNVAEMELAPVTNMSDLLLGRAAGVSILQSSGTSGTGSRVRIRGANSVSLSNEPLLVIDGVRIDNSPNNLAISVGGQFPSRLNDINPEEIESIEILKGPAAAAMYGTAAANGVIQITTRRGRSGAAQWRVYSELGTLEDRHQYPANYDAEGTGPVAGFCILFYATRGLCEQTEVLSHNLLMDPESRPFRTGARRKIGANVSGGTDIIQYFIAGDVDREDGIYEISELDRINLRANVNARLTDNLDLALTTGYLFSNLILPPNDNNLFGVVSGALLGGATPGAWVLFEPETLFLRRPEQDIGRFIGSANATYRPTEWLAITGVAGADLLNRHDHMTLPAEVFPFGDNIDGFRNSNRYLTQTYTANLNASAGFDLTDAVTSMTSVGVQYNEEITRGTEAYGEGLLPGVGGLDGVATRFAVGEFNLQVVTLGAYLQQQFGFGDRLFLTGALRGDDNSAFGSDFGLVVYPSLSASWVASDEAWFPQFEAISSTRLRAAWGRSGLRPGMRDARRFLEPLAQSVGDAEVPAFTLGGVGRADLRPEISTEIELGADLGFLADRVSLELTYYDKTARDALILRTLAPSAGVATTRFENIGEMSNRGFEGLLNAQVLNVPRVRWNAGLNASWNRNTLVELGEDIEPIIFGLGGNTQRHQEGFPAGGYWATPIEGWEVDANGAITIEYGDTAVFMGSTLPTRQIGINTDLTLFDVVRISGLIDHRGGNRMLNYTEGFRCGSFFNCEAQWDPSASEWDQVRAQAASPLDGVATQAGYMEDASFWKLRELSLGLMAPRDWAQRLRANSLGITFSGRNLATWTGYTGFDPEVNALAQFNFSQADFLSQPPVRQLTVRLDLGF
jgi:TonB-dependent starch-binding outer membrane protein SusC